MNITVANTEIFINQGPTGVLCSGGADSAVVVYLLMKYSPGPLTVFTVGNARKNYLNIDAAINVIKKCKELTSKTDVTHITRTCHTQTKEEVFSNEFMTYADNNTVDVIYTGFTTNPPKDVTDTFIEQSDLTVRDPSVTRPLWHRDNTVYTPFANIDKRTIAEMYTELDILDSLFPQTRSCEWHADMNVDDPGIGHCGKCWWCEERFWAFNRLS